MNTVLGCTKHNHKDLFDDENACSGGCKSIYGPLVGADSLENYIFENKVALARVKDLSLKLKAQEKEIDGIHDKLVEMNDELLGQDTLKVIVKELSYRVQKEDFDDAIHSLQHKFEGLANKIGVLESYHYAASKVSSSS